MKNHVIVKRLLDKLFQDKECIKMGGYGDGKGSPYYIHPKYIQRNAIVYSAGVGRDISFEFELVNKYNATIFLFDPSPTGVEFMENNKYDNIHYFKLGFAEKTGERKFSQPDKPNEGSFRTPRKGKNILKFNCISVKDFMKKKGHKKIDLLKIDIEGFEYGVIKNILDNDIEITQICVEFHDWTKDIPSKWTRDTIKRLKVYGYKLVYRDVDNYTFVKNWAKTKKITS